METAATHADATTRHAALPASTSAQSMPILTTPSPKVPLHQFGAMQIEEAAGSSEAPAQAEQPTTGREAKWDEEDEVWRCLDCFWEVTQGECAHCAATYERSEETVAREDELLLDPVVPKSRPPSPWLSEAFVAASKEPLAKEEQLKCLLARGATAEMIEHFDLEYSPLHGIIATADDDLENFFFPDGFELAQSERVLEPPSKPESDAEFYPRVPFAMQQPNDKHPWRIHLGESIVLGPSDECGSEFVFNAVESLLWLSDHGAAATVVENFGPFGDDGRQFVTRKLAGDEKIMTLSDFGAQWPSTDHLYDADEGDILCIPVEIDGIWEPLLLVEAKKSPQELEDLNSAAADAWASNEAEAEQVVEPEAEESEHDVDMEEEEELVGETKEEGNEPDRMEDEPGEIFDFP